MPVGVNPKTQEAVYRAVGRGGVVIVGEGARGRLTRLVNDERSKVQRVASGVPVTVIYVGHGEGDVSIAKLAPTIKSLPKKVDKLDGGRRHQAHRVGLAVADVAADPEGHRPDEGARAPSSLTWRRSGPKQHRSGRLVVQAALIGVPDDRRDHDDQQQPCAPPGATGRSMRRRGARARRPNRRWPGLPCSVGMKTIWIAAKIARIASGSHPKKPEIRYAAP